MYICKNHPVCSAEIAPTEAPFIATAWINGGVVDVCQTYVAGCYDCGFCAIAYATTLPIGNDPATWPSVLSY